VERRARLLLDKSFTPAPAQLEEWLAEAAALEGRLEEFRALRERAQGDAARSLQSAIASTEENEYAVRILDDIVEDLEALKGSRGSIPLVRARLEQRAGAAPAPGSTEGESDPGR